MIKCGMCEVNITPALDCSIPGYFKDRRSTGIKDELYSKALVIEMDYVTIATIVIDAVMVSRKIVLEIRKRINRYTGIRLENIMISATHTHSGGPINSGLECTLDEIYVDMLVRKSADAVIMAFNNRILAQIGYGTGSVKGISFNRRYFMKDGTVRTNPDSKDPNIVRAEGPIDEDLGVLRIDDMEGNPIGVVTNFACHLDVVGGTEISADFPGEMSKYIKKALGDKVISLFVAGTSGNINHFDIKNEETISNPVHYKKMGKIIGYEALKVREGIKYRDLSDIRVSNDTFTLNLRTPTEQDIKWAKDILSLKESGDSGEYANTVMKSTEDGFAKEILKLAQSDLKAVDIELQVFRIGNISMIALPGEIFVEFGLAIKEKSPFDLNIIGTLSNGSSYCYIPTMGAFKNGGYEPRLTGEVNLEEKAGDIIVSRTLELLKD